jgi:hypothetical protein
MRKKVRVRESVVAIQSIKRVKSTQVTQLPVPINNNQIIPSFLQTSISTLSSRRTNTWIWLCAVQKNGFDFASSKNDFDFASLTFRFDFALSEHWFHSTLSQYATYSLRIHPIQTVKSSCLSLLKNSWPTLASFSTRKVTLQFLRIPTFSQPKVLI